MDNIEIIATLSALAQTTRLDTFRLLVSREPNGVAASDSPAALHLAPSGDGADRLLAALAPMIRRTGK